MGGGGAHRKEGPEQVGVHHRLEIGRGGVEDRADRGAAGAHHQRVEAAEEGDRLASHPGDVGLAGGVALGKPHPAEGAEPAGGLGERRAAAAGDEHPGAFLQHRLGTGHAEAGAAAIDQRPLALETAAGGGRRCRHECDPLVVR